MSGALVEIEEVLEHGAPMRCNAVYCMWVVSVQLDRNRLQKADEMLEIVERGHGKLSAPYHEALRWCSHVC